MATQSRKRSDITVDFTGVEGGGGGRILPEGEHTLEVAEIKEKMSRDDNPYLAWKWKVPSGDYKGTMVYDNTSLQPQALWRLKGLLEALGVDVDNGKQGINFGELTGKTCKVEIAREEYQGKTKHRISAFILPEVKSSPELVKKGDKVTFDTGEDGVVSAVVISCTKGKAVISVTVDGSEEEWEVDASELTLD